MENPKETQESLGLVLRIARMGFRVIPVYSIRSDGKCSCGNQNCRSPGKHPRTRNGLTDGTTNEERIRQYWRSDSQCNWAICTDDVVVVDRDDRHGGKASLDEFESLHGKLPATVTVETPGGGTHQYFRSPIVPIGTRAGVLPGLDIRAKGGYALIPPSNHAAGKVYKFAEGRSFDEITIAELPQDIAAALTAKTAKNNLLQNEGGRILEGNRNDTLFQQALKLRSANLPDEVGLNALRQSNLKSCVPPVEEEEIQSLWRNSAKYGPAALNWAEPRPFALPEASVPALSEYMLPKVLWDWASDFADRIQAPIDLIAAPAVTAISGLLGNSVLIQPKANDPSWREAPNLWCAIVAPSGLFKSPCFAEAMRPINRLQNEANKKFQDSIATFEAEKLASESRIEKLKKELKESKTPEQVTAKIAGEVAALESLKPTHVRFVTQDATIEKLSEILRSNPTGLIVCRDELPGFLEAMKKPGKEGDRAFYLESWVGKNPFITDRIGRGTVCVDKLCLTIVGAIQPERLNQYFASVLSEDSGEDGLLARFQVLVFPVHSTEFTLVDRAPLPEVLEQVDELFERLLKLRASAKESGDVCFSFSGDAQPLFNDFLIQLERRLRSSEIKSPAFRAHISKYRSLVPSLALIFHLIEPEDSSPDVGVRSLLRAKAFCEYLEAHARKIYLPAIHPEAVAASKLLERINAGSVTDGMTVRDLIRKEWSGLKTASLVEAGLIELQKLGWLKVQEIRANEAGGAPSRVLRLNPRLMRES
jgi:hypothetical protein